MNWIEDALQYDEHAWGQIQDAINQNIDYIGHCWHYGDGNGGAIIEYIKARLLEAGHITRLQAPRPLYVKQPIPSSLRWRVFKRDGYSCVLCGSDSDLTADHVTPESRGGEATEDNLQTLCRKCNSKKGAKPAEELSYPVV